MKTKLIVIILSILNFNSFGQGIEFFQGTYKEALEKAAKEEKLVFIDAFASWCGPCKRMASTVFTEKEVGDFYNKNFINMQIDMEKGEGPSLSGKFGVTAYPTFLFVNGKGEIVNRKVGGMAPDAFINVGKTAADKIDYSSDLSKEYESGNRNPDFILRYIISLNKSNKSPLKIANDYLSAQTDQTTPENLKIIHQAAVESDSRIFTTMIKYKDLIIPLVGKEAFQKKIKEACENTVNKAIEFQIPDLLTEAKATITKYNPDAAAEFGYESDMKYYKSIGEMTNYCKACVEYAQKYLKNDGEKLFKLAQNLEQHHFADEDAMKSAEKIALLATKAGDKVDYLMLYARILERNNKIKQALSIAKKAGDLAGNDLGVKQNIDNYIHTLEKTN
ncbi:MAG TPA: thioredoxin family protein [Saprospiraceae bacterium]|nr:thioredoxin family protein [Saprospiraceae bacterium]